MSAIFFWGSLAVLMACVGAIAYAIFILVKEWKHYDSQTRTNAVIFALKGIAGIGFMGIVSFIVLFISWSFYQPGWGQILAGLGIGAIIAVVVFDIKKRKKDTATFVAAAMAKNKSDADVDMADFHIEKAIEAERAGDYLGARVSYMQYVETLKRADQPEALEDAKKKYAEFVKRDPIFNKMLPFFIDGVRQNPGILQSAITAKAEEMDWREIRQYSRTISKDDIRYVFYFAEEFGLLVRQKKGRSYQLYLPEHSDLIEQKEVAEAKAEKVSDTNNNKAEEKAKMRADSQRRSYERAMASSLHPYLMYRLGNSLECEKAHLHWEGLILPKDDPWWDTHLPPNGLYCQCYTVSVSEARKKRYEEEGIPTAPRADGSGGGTIPVKKVVPDE